MMMLNGDGVEVELVDGVYPAVIVTVADGFEFEVEPFFQLEQSPGGPVRLSVTFREVGELVNPLLGVIRGRSQPQA